MSACSRATARRSCVRSRKAHKAMYLPKDFKEDRVPVLHEAIRRARLGTLVTMGADGIEASHVPMLVQPEPSPFGTLPGHIAPANPQCRPATRPVPPLATSPGPHPP